MEKEIKFNITDGYKARLAQLDSLLHFLNISFEKIKEINPNWMTNEDYRISIYSILMSIIVNTKTNLYLLQKFLSSEDWENIYFSKIIPNEMIISKGKYYGFFKDLDMDYRFLFFHQLFAQLEFYIRKVYFALNLKKGKCPITFVKKEYPKYLTLLDSIEVIRNTIHNNGHYIPIGKQPLSTTIKLNTIMNINSGEQIIFNWDDAFYMLNEVINCINDMNKSDIIKTISKI